MESRQQIQFDPHKHWKQFCSFVKSGLYTTDATDCGEKDCLSVLILLGGQNAWNLLYRNGLCQEEIAKLQVVLAQLEELCLKEVVKAYKTFSYPLESDDNVAVSTIEDTGLHKDKTNGIFMPCDVLQCDSEIMSRIGDRDMKPTAKKPDISSLINENEMIEKDQVATSGEEKHKEVIDEKCHIEKSVEEKGNNEDNIIHGVIVDTEVTQGKTHGRRRKVCLAEKKENLESVKTKIDNLLNNQRRSSREIRISSRYAQNKDVIKNLLKPDIIPISFDKFSPDPPCVCSSCKQNFPDSKTLVSHWNASHHQKGRRKHLPFSCAVCQKQFALYSHLKSHYKKRNLCKKSKLNGKDSDLHEMQRESESQDGDQQMPQEEGNQGNDVKSSSFQCQLCEKTFKNKRSLESHRTVHTGERPYVCDVCGKSFRLKLCLKNHSRLHDAASHVKCDICGRTCLDQVALQKHKLVHSNIKPYFCTVCGKEFRRLQGFKNHQRLHKNDETFQCNICGRKFVDKWGMIRHKTVHTGEKPFICNKCGKMFRLKRGLENHMLIHETDCKHVCHLCPRKFVSKKKLEVHLVAHTGDKPFICDKCGKRFLHSTNLKVHKRVHTGEKPYKCQFCDKTFAQQGTLIAHERYHTGDRPYVCNLCDERFITASHLTVHTRKHYNDRPHKCDQCDYAAYTASILKIHKLKHSGGRPHKCTQCSAAFKRPQHLEAHKRTHLNKTLTDINIKKYKCAYCEESFDSDAGLTSHLSTHEIVIVSTKKAVSDILIDNNQGPEEVAYNIVVL